MQNRNRKIDILRGASILFVILLHLNIRIPFKGTFIGEIMPDFLYKFLFWSGYYGRNCYEIYLTHMFVVIGAVALFEYAGLDNGWIWILYISTVALSGLAGGLIAGHFTGPANRYLRNMYFCNRHPNP